MERTLIQNVTTLPVIRQLPVANDGREFVRVYTHRVLVLVEDKETGRNLDHIIVQAESLDRLKAKLDSTLAGLRFNWVPRDRIDITWKEV